MSNIGPTDEEVKLMRTSLKLDKMQDVVVENTSKVGTPFYLAPELLYEETR